MSNAIHPRVRIVSVDGKKITNEWKSYPASLTIIQAGERHVSESGFSSHDEPIWVEVQVGEHSYKPFAVRRQVTWVASGTRGGV